MALNRIYKENVGDNRARVVPEGTQSGDPLLIEDRPAVALTDRGDAERTVTLDDISFTYPSGGASLEADEASLAFNGTFRFPVTGATSGDSAQGTVVYITAANALTLTEATNTRYGTVDKPIGWHDIAGELPVRVGG